MQYSVSLIGECERRNGRGDWHAEYMSAELVGVGLGERVRVEI
jgi:hypothetical protein